MAKLTYAQVSALLKYEAETGKLFWKERSPDQYAHTTKPAALAKTFNATFAGKEAFTYTDSNGYKCGNLMNKPDRAHRIIWLLTTGNWPEHGVDHINGDPADNRIINLRAADQRTNCRNQTLNKRNTSGTVGVRYDGKRNKWVAYIAPDGKPTYLGSFDEFEGAAERRQAADVEHGFSPGHGRRVR